MKNIESKLIEVRSYDPPKAFSDNANLKKADLDLLKKEFEDNSDLFWSKLEVKFLGLKILSQYVLVMLHSLSGLKKEN